MKWVYKAKKNAKEEINRYKEIFVTKGYCQITGIDHDEIFAHIIRLETIKLIISFATKNKWKIRKFTKLVYLFCHFVKYFIF